MAADAHVSTGRLPAPEQVQAWVDEAHARFARRRDRRGLARLSGARRGRRRTCSASASSAPAAASTPSGDADAEFTIMSVSKPFVFALVCERLGADGAARPRRRQRHRAAVQLARRGRVAAATAARTRWSTRARSPPRACSGDWDVDPRRPVALRRARAAARRGGVRLRVARPTTATRRIARLLQDCGRIYADPAEAVDLYTRQCSLRVSARDLAVMGATLADGGVNPSPASAWSTPRSATTRSP